MENIFLDKQGKRVIAQKPNLPIIAWAMFVVLGKLPFPDQAVALFSLLAFGSIFTWAWMELFQGVNTFRRILGGVVMLVVIYRYLGL